MGKALKTYADWRQQQNLLDHSFYVKKFTRLLLSMFEWKNLPDGISPMFLEKTLLQQGYAVFFKHTAGFYQVSRASVMGFNCYDEPIAYKTFDVTGHTQLVMAKDCVCIWNDPFKEGNAINVHFFAKRLSNIEKTIDCNLDQMKHPLIVTCPEGQEATVRAFYNDIVNGTPFMPVKEGFFANSEWSAWDMKVQNHVTELQAVKHDYENEALTFFGINNVNVLKRERLITGEAEQNDEQISLNKNAMLLMREKACEEMKELSSKKDISVTLSTRIVEELDQFIEEGDDPNE